MYRPPGWIPVISFEEITKINPSLVSMMTIKERKFFEAGADAMLKALEPIIRDIAPSSKLVDIMYTKKEKTNE